MTHEEAVRWHEASREARWTYPSSSGRPVPRTPPEWATRLVAQKERFVEAAPTASPRARALALYGDGLFAGGARELLAHAEEMLSKLGVDPSAEDQTEIAWIRAHLSRPAGEEASSEPGRKT